MAPISSDYPIVSSGGGGTWKIAAFTASGTFTKPATSATPFPVLVQAIGGGGGGGGGGALSSYSSIHSKGEGGGGGGSAVYQERWIACSTNLTITIGAGGTAGTAGGSTDHGGKGGVGGTTKIVDTASKILIACLGAQGGAGGKENGSGSHSTTSTPTGQGTNTWIAGAVDHAPMGIVYPSVVGESGIAPISPGATDGQAGAHSVLYRSGDINAWDKTGYTSSEFDYGGTTRGPGDALDYGWPAAYQTALLGSSASPPQPHVQSHGGHGAPSIFGPGAVGGVGAGYGVGGVADSSTRGPTTQDFLAYGSGGGGGAGGWSNDGGSDLGSTPGGLGLVGGAGYAGVVFLYYWE